MSKNVTILLEKLFDLRSGEYRRALLMQAYIFLIIFTLLIVKPTANSLFLSEFGVENLPYAFILVAALAAIVSTLYSRWLKYAELQSIIRNTLWTCIGSLVTFGILLNLGIFGQLVLYLFYLWVMIFALLATSQFWVLANVVFNAREAKRLFGFIGAGAIAGGILGGYVASLLAQITASEHLLFVAAGFLLFCFPILKAIYNSIQTQQKPKIVEESKPIDDHPFHLILASKHLSYLAGIVGISVVVAKLIDFEFSGIAAAHFTDKDELTAFFGIWFSTFNVISLFLQLFLTQRIMQSISVSRALYLMPLFIIFSTALMLVMPEVLLVAVFLKMTDGSLKQSVNKAAMELMILPIPIRVKNSAKTFIDVFVDSLATGFSGILLIFIIKGMGLPYIAINILILLLTIVWIGLIYKIREEYLNSFKLQVSKVNALPIDINYTPNSPIHIHQKRSVRRWIQTMEKGTERQILTALRRVGKVPVPKPALSEKLKHLLRHPSKEVRAAVVEKMRRINDPELIKQMEFLLEYDAIKVKIKALEYLLHNDEKNALENIEYYFENSHYQLRGTALIGLAKMTIPQPELRKEYHLDARLFDWYQEIKILDDEKEIAFRIVTFLKAIGYGRLEDYYGYIHQYLQSNQPDLVKQAIKSAGLTNKEVYLNLLIVFLEKKIYRGVAQRALMRYANKAFPVFIEVIKNPEINIKVIRSLPRIIRKSESKEALDILQLLTNHKDDVVRRESLWSLNRMRMKQPELYFNQQEVLDSIMKETHIFEETLSIIWIQKKNIFKEKKMGITNTMERYTLRNHLIKLLEKQLDNNLERIFLLLGLKYSPDDTLSIYRGIRCSKHDLRANALEFLDNLLGINLKKIIIPIIETAMLEEVSAEAIRQLNLSLPSELETLEKMMTGTNKNIQMAAYKLYKLLYTQEESNSDVMKNRVA